MNNLEFLIPIVLFLSIAWTIKAVLDARVRRQMVESNGSEALVRSILEGEEARRRHGSLRWGIVLLALGIGFAAVDLQGVQEVTPGVIAALLVATGLGNLAYFLAARRLKA
jgi:TRAP-type mannitol/chloroaromatic compound transport system permease small subunit